MTTCILARRYKISGAPVAEKDRENGSFWNIGGDQTSDITQHKIVILYVKGTVCRSLT
jgi:hypothetical protein